MDQSFLDSIDSLLNPFSGCDHAFCDAHAFDATFFDDDIKELAVKTTENFISSGFSHAFEEEPFDPSIFESWKYTLTKLLIHWEAEVEMDLDEAASIMLNTAFPSYHDKLFGNNDFWFKAEEYVSNLPLPSYIKNKACIYMMTIAIFETIAYWCWHDAPLQIVFNELNLKGILKNGNINIDWSQY